MALISTITLTITIDLPSSGDMSYLSLVSEISTSMPRTVVLTTSNSRTNHFF